ncbi:acyltransferase domain-containing protein [Pendulispora brunnea]|uniref:Acyltransferase domain-containing protein n=1 Tax=Pendulispora brunnea TaxID=2905690 RepID=A0ABZ2JY22_9BACT
MGNVVQQQEQHDLIAVVAMNGRFPGADGIEPFWKNIREGRESISFFSDEELADAGVDQATLRHPKYVKARGVVRGIKMFDPLFFGFSHREAAYTDPQQRLFLECAWELFERAGYDLDAYAGSVGVFAGSAISSYLLNNLWPNRELVHSVDPYHLVLANDKDHLTTRLAYKLNLKGPCVTVQTGCSTSLVAIHMACQALLNRECDMALAGGVALSIPQVTGYLYQENNKNSPDGHTRTFDARAQGTVQSEGAALVLLKRLDDALLDGDTIHAVVRGSAINNDGAAKVSYTAPSIDGQADVIRTAQLLADVPVDSIQYVECHGTATAMGDPIEVAALTKAFRAATEREGFCALGSLKSNVGHMDTAAGAAGFIKTALALHHACIPPSLHFEAPNEQIDFARSPFFVNTQPRAWERGDHPRRAAVSAFGVGGTNAHVILEEPCLRAPSDPATDWQLLLLSAKSEAALQRSTSNLLAYLESHPDANLADVAYTLQVGRKAFEHRRALVCRDTHDAVATLRELPPQRVFTKRPHAETPVVFMFPGQVPLYEQMGRELYEREPAFRAAMARCAEHMDSSLPGAAPKAGLGAQPALFAFEYALAQLWLSWGVEPHAYMGHSMGEYVAATLAGVLDLPDALRLVAARERLLQGLPRGAILTVLADESVLRGLVEHAGEHVAITAFNAPGVHSISGPLEAIDALQTELQRRGIVHNRLPVSLVSHGSMVDPIVGAFRRVLEQVTLRQPETPYLSGVTGQWITADEAMDPEYWVRHLREPVRFSQGMSTLLAQSKWILLEVGPGRTLSSLVHPHERGSEQVILASIPSAKANTEAESMLQALGKLWAAGGAIDRRAILGHTRRSRLVLPTYPFERQRCWIDAENTLEEPPIVPRESPAFVEATEISDSQRIILRFWHELLGTPTIDLHDDFFDLGGNSLLGIQLHTRLKEQFDVEISLKDLLEKTTVAGMADLVELTILEEIESLHVHE